MLEHFNEPVAFFRLIMSIILVMPLLSERLQKAEDFQGGENVCYFD